MFERAIEGPRLAALAESPAVALLGPRARDRERRGWPLGNGVEAISFIELCAMASRAAEGDDDR